MIPILPKDSWKVNYTDFIKQVCAKLNLSYDLETAAIDFGKRVQENEICTGRHPMNVAGVCVYFIT